MCMSVVYIQNIEMQIYCHFDQAYSAPEKIL